MLVAAGFCCLKTERELSKNKVATVSQCKIRILIFVGWAASWVAPPMVCQDSPASRERIVKIPPAGGEPAFVLQISTERSRGVVSVRNEKNAEVQRLTCPLLRDNAEATEGELAATREQFVSKFTVRDLDFDGHPDLAGIREFGAKWARYCVWLYDPKQHIFTKDFLAEQMELLTNLEPFTNGQISSSYIGPENMWRAVHRVMQSEESRPQRQLIPLSSCLVETAPGGERPTAVVMARYERGQPVVQRYEAEKMGARAAFNICN